jgi:hypothetical protein
MTVALFEGQRQEMIAATVYTLPASCCPFRLRHDTAFNASTLNAGPVLCWARTLGRRQKRQKSSVDEVFASVRAD